MKRLFSTAFATLLLSTSFAVADEGFFSLDGLSVGVSAVQADIDVNEPGISVNGEATGWRIFGLYEFNDRFGIEGGMSSYDRPDDPTIPSTSEAEHESFDLFAVGTLPMTEKLDLFGKVGFVSSETEIEDEFNEVESTSTDLALAFGGEYDLTKRFAARAEIQWVDSQNAGAANLISIGGVYKFQ